MSMKTLLIATALCVPALCMAGKPKPGSYSLAGIQNICIKSDNTWYGETYSGWGGAWSMVGTTAALRGNYAGGTGNDGMTFKGSVSTGFNGVWQEWHDDLSFNTAFAATLTYNGATCAAPPASVQGGKANPAQQ